jgi:hypothetical protein
MVATKIARGADQSLAEMILPEPVDQYARGEGVGGRGDPSRQAETPLLFRSERCRSVSIGVSHHHSIPPGPKNGAGVPPAIRAVPTADRRPPIPSVSHSGKC